MQLGRCCKCSQNPITDFVHRHLRAVGPLPSELGTDTGQYVWGPFNIRTQSVNSNLALEPYRNRVGYYLTLPPGVVANPYPLSTTVLAQPFRYELHDWSEGFYGFLQRQNSPFSPYPYNHDNQYPQPYDASRRTGTVSDLGAYNTYQKAPPTKKYISDSVTHLQNFSATRVRWSVRSQGDDRLLRRIGFPGIGDVYVNVRGTPQLAYSVSNGTILARLLADGEDVTGVVQVKSGEFGDTGQSLRWFDVDLAPHRGKTIHIDLWHGATIYPAPGSAGGLVDQVGYIGSWPGENIVEVGGFTRSSVFQNYKIVVAGPLVGGVSQAIVGTPPTGWFYNGLAGAELFGVWPFPEVTSNSGEGFRFVSNSEVPIIQVFKPTPGAVSGSVAKRVVWYAPQNNNNFSDLVLPSGYRHTQGAWNQSGSTVFVPYAQGFYYQPSLNLPPQQWKDFAGSGNTPPSWTPGDSIYSDFPTSITVSPP